MGIMAYFVISLMVIILFLLLPKGKARQNILRSLAIAIIAYECYLCLVAGILSIVKIPISCFSISLVNIIIIFCILGMLCKQKKIQQYYVVFGDILFVIILAGIVTIMFLKRYTSDIQIVFETSDPSVHLQGAMDFVNSRTVSGMYIGQLINGLTIEGLRGIYSGTYIYKSFVLQYGFNFFMAGFIFWAAVSSYANCIAMKILAYTTTILYILGYPYNDMIFGFVYLQLTISVVAFIFAVVQDYLTDKVDSEICYILISIGCLATGIGYTLFAPIVYISAFLCVAYKIWQENEKRFNIIMCKKIALTELGIFLCPTILTVWTIVISPSLESTVPDYVNVLKFEGYIYKNLFSDFAIYVIPGFYGIVRSIKIKKINFNSFLLPLFYIYYIFFLYRMLTDQVSTYYFYKLNFLMWLIILVCFVIGMYEIFNSEKILFDIIVSSYILLGVIYISKFEVSYNAKNANYVPYIASADFFRIYQNNEYWSENKAKINDGIVEVCNFVNAKDNTEPIVFIGYWIDKRWYEAMTNQRIGDSFNAFEALPYAEVLDGFQNGLYGKSIVITKSAIQNNEDFSKFGSFLATYNIAYENDYAYVVENSKHNEKLNNIINITEYMHELKRQSDNYIIFISVKDDASNINDEIQRAFQELGMKEFRNDFRASYIGIMENASSIIERYDDQYLDASGTINELTYSIVSPGFDYSINSQIILNGIDYSVNQRGFNIVVYKKESKQVIDSVNFDPMGDGTLFRETM